MKFLVAFAAVSVLGFTVAENSAFASVYASPAVVITSVGSDNTGNLFFGTNNNAGMSGCTTGSYNQIAYIPNAFTEAKAIALAAYLSGKSVVFIYQTDTGTVLTDAANTYCDVLTVLSE